MGLIVKGKIDDTATAGLVCRGDNGLLLDIYAANNLMDLCEQLNAIDWHMLSKIDPQKLPSFSVEPPIDITGVYSWDSNRVLVRGTDSFDWFLLTRCEACGEVQHHAPRYCRDIVT